MKKILIVAALAMGLLQAEAGWKNLNDAGWYSGPKLSDGDLNGKVVLVDCWGVNCPPCRALLPRMEAIWKTYKNKPFVLIGSHCQGHEPAKVADLVKANNLTYPIYDRAGVDNEPKFPGLPFFYVVNHRGKIIFQGDGVKGTEQEAIKAIESALNEIGAPPTLYGGVTLMKFKALKKKLVLGQAIKSDVKKLQDAANGKNEAMAEEAKAILAAIEESKAQTKEAIDTAKTTKPDEALKLIKLSSVTFPDVAAEYKDELPEIQKAAAEAKKAAAAEAKKNGGAKRRKAK